MLIAPDHLSTTLAALADPTRRAILARLATGEATVTELAAPFAISHPAVSRHLKVLERAGLITRGREAQWRPCRLEAKPLRDVADWVEQYRRFWDESIDCLEDHLRELQTNNQMSRKMTEASRSTKPTPKQSSTGSTSSRPALAARELVITRIIDAPRALVFKAWTDPKHVVQWWGPHGFTNPVCEMDVRPGGVWRMVMRGPDVVEYPNKGVFREIVEPERLVFTYGLENEELSHESLATVTFAEHEGKTKLTMHQTLLDLAKAREGASEDWTESLDRLAEYLAKA